MQSRLTLKSDLADELFKYLTVSRTWKKLDTYADVKGTPPSARSDHRMTTVGQDIYLFGGDPGV